MHDHNVLKLGINICTYVLKRSTYLFSSVALLGLCCCVWAFSRCNEQGPRSSPALLIASQASHCGGLSWGAPAAGPQASAAAAGVLSPWGSGL